MKTVLNLFIFLIFSSAIAACNSFEKEQQQIEKAVKQAIQSYKSEENKLPQVQGKFFIQEILPYIEDSLIREKYLIANKVEILLPNDEKEYLPIYSMGVGGKVIVFRLQEHGYQVLFEPDDIQVLKIDTTQDSSLIKAFATQFEIMPPPKPRLLDTLHYDPMVYPGDRYEFRLHLLREKYSKTLINSLIQYKNRYGYFPKTRGKYFLNFIIPFYNDHKTTYWVKIIDIPIPIYYFSESRNGFLSYFTDNADNFTLYWTGRNGVDEGGQGDDIILNLESNN